MDETIRNIEFFPKRDIDQQSLRRGNSLFVQAIVNLVNWSNRSTLGSLLIRPEAYAEDGERISWWSWIDEISILSTCFAIVALSVIGYVFSVESVVNDVILFWIACHKVWGIANSLKNKYIVLCCGWYPFSRFFCIKNNDLIGVVMTFLWKN